VGLGNGKEIEILFARKGNLLRKKTHLFHSRGKGGRLERVGSRLRGGVEKQYDWRG